ncbi:MAG TPA: ribbon-helix-helix domain-containing protein [Thermoplasmata archaeon]|nr:ribbon-helix-helix domain-containing protein [Thermoplasmata archaeon]HUU07395.1 ribbon-helix-helix domain-containing protein [Thermoplasmata archaeon]
MPDPLENERITLRLDADELRLMDEFIVSSREFSNRSQLARTAISIYIESRAGGEEGTIIKANEVVVQLPPLVLDTIAHLVAEGMYSNISEAVADCARHQFIHEEHVESIKKDAVQQRSALKVVPKA